MILVGYQLKKEIMEACTKYERDKNPSINSIIEDFLESFLTNKGYLTDNVNFDKIKSPEEIMSESEYNFRKGRIANGSVQVFCDELYFGYVKQDKYYERVDELMQFPRDELDNLSKNNWDDSNGTYHTFLKWKISHPTLSLEDYLVFSRFDISYISSKESWQIKHDNFSMCSCKDGEAFEKIKEYLFHLSDKELAQLKIELRDTGKNRRKYILDKIGESTLMGDK